MCVCFFLNFFLVIKVTTFDFRRFAMGAGCGLLARSGRSFSSKASGVGGARVRGRRAFSHR